MTEPATNPEPAPTPAADTSITLDHWVARAKTAEAALAARDAEIEAAGRRLFEIGCVESGAYDEHIHITGRLPKLADCVEAAAESRETMRQLASGWRGRYDEVKAQLIEANARVAARDIELGIAYDEFKELREGRTDPGLLRWCEWPGCLAHYNAVTGPDREGGTWVHLRRTHGVMCPDHVALDHLPSWAWEPGDEFVTAHCSCGEFEQVRPATSGAAHEWWQSHIEGWQP